METKELESIIIKKQNRLGSLNEKEAILRKRVEERFSKREELLRKGFTEEQIEQLILKGKEEISKRYSGIKTRIRKEIILLDKEIAETNN